MPHILPSAASAAVPVDQEETMVPLRDVAAEGSEGLSSPGSWYMLSYDATRRETSVSSWTLSRIERHSDGRPRAYA